MKKNRYLAFSLGILMLAGLPAMHSCLTPSGSPRGKSVEIAVKMVANPGGNGPILEIGFQKGKSFNHPTFAVWLEDSTGRFLQTLFVTRAFGLGLYDYGDKTEGQWKPGYVSRPASLPLWSHRAGAALGIGRYVPDISRPVPDAYSGATPKGSFSLEARSDQPLHGRVKLFLEINQTWDWNEYWTNNKYPEDREYKTSCQPAVVYSAWIDPGQPGTGTALEPVGRSSHSGSDGTLYTDLHTLTTALHIAEKITVTIREE